jgi:hypothetical protein
MTADDLEDSFLDIFPVKYQIVVTHAGGTQMILGTYPTLEDAHDQYEESKEAMVSGTGSMIVRDPDWNHLQLQRVEILEEIYPT